jgi:hypothetical protein
MLYLVLAVKTSEGAFSHDVVTASADIVVASRVLNEAIHEARTTEYAPKDGFVLLGIEDGSYNAAELLLYANAPFYEVRHPADLERG